MYAESLKEGYMFELSSLTSSEKKIINRAMDDMYYVENSNNEAFKSLIEKLHRHRAIKRGDEYSGDWLVRYKQEIYWIQATYGQLQ